jgi:LacI family transcriptional regulator
VEIETTSSKSATIYDIAKKSGVSLSTVSRVLGNKTPVSQEKYEAVMRAIADLNYTPNIHAQNLAQGHSNTIGVLIPTSSSPFYGEILLGIDDSLKDTPYHALITSTRIQSVTEEKEVLELLDNRRVDALIILGGNLPATQLREIAQRLPLLIIGRLVSGLEKNCLVVDNYQGAYQATQYLIEMGHTRIAHITGALSMEDALQRKQGYRQALIDAGIGVDERLIIEGDYREQAGLLGVEGLLMRGVPFTSIFLANDQMAWGACLALHRRGIRIPQDISLVGFDDVPTSAYAIPPLTTVHVPITEMGKVAAQIILGRLSEKQVALPTFPIKLVVRESVAPLALYGNGSSNNNKNNNSSSKITNKFR